MNDRQSFLKEVMLGIKSKEAQKFIIKELDYHITEIKKRFIKNGESEENAEEKAIKEMGNPVQIGKQLNKIHRPKFDWYLIGLFTIIIGLGFLPFLVLTELNLPGYQYLIFKKLISVGLGFAVVIGLMFFNYRLLKNAGYIFYLLGIILLLMVHFKWSTINVNGVPYFQFGPVFLSPLITLPIFLIAWASLFQNKHFTLWRYVFLFSPSILLYLSIGNYTTICTYILMVTCMSLWWGSKERMKVIKTFIVTWSVIIIAFLQYLIFNISPEMKVRIAAFLNPEQFANDAGFIYLKIQRLVNNAGWFGHQVIEKGYYIPDSYSNFVFVALTYSLGWIFSLVLIILLSLLVIRMFTNLSKITDLHGRLLVIGSVCVFTIPFVLNIGMSLGILPILNVSLPFISYGMMPILINSVLIGFVLSVYRLKDLTAKIPNINNE